MQSKCKMLVRSQGAKMELRESTNFAVPVDLHDATRKLV